MKAKSNFSELLDESTRKGGKRIFAAIAIFIGAFLIWSLSCMGGAIVCLLNS